LREIKSPSEPNSEFVSAAIRVAHLLIPIFLRSGLRSGKAVKTLRNSLGLNYKSAALNQLSYAGKNAAHINARRRSKQVADLRNASAS
jgi:hypothetical protein